MDGFDKFIMIVIALIFFIGITIIISQNDYIIDKLKGEEIFYKIEKDEKGVLYVVPVDQ